MEDGDDIEVLPLWGPAPKLQRVVDAVSIEQRQDAESGGQHAVYVRHPPITDPVAALRSARRDVPGRAQSPSARRTPGVPTTANTISVPVTLMPVPPVPRGECPRPPQLDGRIEAGRRAGEARERLDIATNSRNPYPVVDVATCVSKLDRPPIGGRGLTDDGSDRLDAMTEEESGPVVARLLFGDELRKFRETLGMTVEQAETRLKEHLPKWYKTKLNKVENGGLKTTEAEVAALLALYGVTGEAAAKVERLAVEARRKVAPARVPDWFKQFVSLSRSADEMRMWSGDLIPGEVQTAEYARECLAESVSISAAEVGPIAEDRERRGDALFGPRGPKVWVVVGEEALLREIGTKETRRGQLVRLRKLADQPNASVRVVALNAGAHPAIGYPFTLLYLPRAKATIAYVETLTDADYIKKSETYTLAFKRLEQKALTEDDTRAMLDRLIADVS